MSPIEDRSTPAPLLELKHVAAAALMVAIFWEAGKTLYTNWTLVDSYYSHGFLVPVVSLVLIWRERAALRRLPATPSTWGVLWIAFGALCLLVSDFLHFAVFSSLAIIPMVVGVLLMLQGRQRVARIWFPLAFLLFMIPIPLSLTQPIAFRLKLIAAECAVRLARLLTLPIVREGSYVHFGDDKLIIGDICGGLRSLIALLALGALMAYMSKSRPWARLLVLILSGPIAVASNVFRIFLLCIVAHFWGSKVAGGTVHDVSGYMIFIVAFTLFFSLESLLRRFAPTEPIEEGGS
jgi:exosortase